jgi:alpha-ketoglutarate-dependent 2,4-dichlorophenoxyacetate dioxygenase
LFKMKLKKIGNTFAAEAVGTDLRQAPGQELREFVESALGDYGVVVFRGQMLDDDQQQAFIQMFGPPVVTDHIKEIASKHPHFST